jgi:hypothetical protein
MLELMRTQGQWRPRRTIFSSRPRSWRMKSLLFKSSGFRIKLTWLRDRLTIWLSQLTVRSSEPKSLSSSKRRWDLITRSKVTKKKSDSWKLPKRISTSKWTSLMISSTKTQISKKNWKMTISILRMNSSKNWRNLKMNLSDLRTISQTWRSRRLTC